MALRPKVLEHAFQAGVNGADHEQLVQPPELLRGRNCQRGKDGAIEKRPGHSNMSATVHRFVPVRSTGVQRQAAWEGPFVQTDSVMEAQEELLMTDGDGLATWDPAYGQWSFRSMATSCVLESNPVAPGAEEHTRTQSAVLNGYRMTVWASGDDTAGIVYFTLEELTTDARVVLRGQTRAIGNYVKCLRVVAVGDSFIVLATANAGAFVRSWTLNLLSLYNNPSPLSDYTDIATGVISPYWMDAVTDGTNFWVVFPANTFIVCKQFNESLVNAWTQTQTGAASDALAVGIDTNKNNNVVIASANSAGLVTTVSYWVTDSSGTVLKAFTTLDTWTAAAVAKTCTQIAVGPGFGAGYIGVLYNILPEEYWDNTNLPGERVLHLITLRSRFIANAASAYGTIATNVPDFYNAHLISTPWLRSRSLFVVVANEPRVGSADGSTPVNYKMLDTVDGCFGLMRLEAVNSSTFGSSGSGDADIAPYWELAGVMRKGLGTGARKQSNVTRVTQTAFGSDIWMFGAEIRTVVRTDASAFGVRATGNREFRTATGFLVDFADRDGRWESVLAGRALAVTGGMVQQYDRGTLEPVGFPFAPVVVNHLAGPEAAQSSQFVYEWIDALGQRHVSRPSESYPKLTTSSATSPVSCKVLCDTWTRRDVRLALFDNQGPAASGGGGAPGASVDGLMHRRYVVVSALVYTYPGLPVGRTVGDRTGAINLSVLDTRPDASETLYTVGGVLENDTPPPCRDIEVWQNRLWAVSTEEKNEVVFSKEIVQDEGIGFSLLLRMQVGHPADPVIAIKAMDSWLVCLKRDSIYVISGDPPNDLGQGSTLRVTRVPVDVGCKTAKSVVLTPGGVMFQSTIGIYLLDRGLSLKYIGKAVADLVTTDVCSATVIAERNIVRFCQRASRVAVDFEYANGEWFECMEPTAVRHACAWQNKHVIAPNSLANAWTEDATHWDAGTNYSMEVTTAWVKASGVQGWQRWWKSVLLGEYRDLHAITVTVQYDYVDVDAETKTFSFNNVAQTVYDTGKYQFEVRPARQTCEAFRLKFTFTPATGDYIPPPNVPAGEGLVADARLTVLRHEVGVPQENVRLPTGTHSRR